jgi:hypothetical protein
MVDIKPRKAQLAKTISLYIQYHSYTVVFLDTVDSDMNPKYFAHGPARQGELDLGVVSLGEKRTPALLSSHCLAPVNTNIE